MVTAYAIAVDVKTAAELLDVHPETVRALIRDGKLRSVRVGRLVRIPREALTEFLSGEIAEGGDAA